MAGAKSRRCPKCQNTIIGMGHLYSGKLYCDSCYPTIIAEAQTIEFQKEELYEFIRKLFGMDILPDSWIISIDKMISSGKTLAGIRMTLTYFYTILGNQPNSTWGLNIVNKYYEDAKQYAIQQQKITTANLNHVDGSKAVTVKIKRPVPKRRPVCNIEDLQHMAGKNTTQKRYIDKLSEMQILACLIKNPLLFTDNKYKFDVDDFGDQFHRIIFGAVDNLASGGVASINYIEIDQFLKNYPTQYKVFVDNEGVDYISNMMDLVDEKNRDYYYKRLKKISVLNSLAARGFDVTAVYDDSIVDPVKLSDMQHKFDNMSVEDILLTYETQITELKEQYTMSGDLEQGKAGDGALRLIDELKQTPEMGLPFTSPKLTTIYRGMILGKLCLESSAQGVGKTRRQAELSCRTAVGEYYDTIKCQWIQTGIHEPSLLISIELELNEVQTMWLACISGVPEHHILDGRYSAGEEERVRKAAKLLEQSELYFVRVSNYNMDDIENIIKKYYQLHGIHYFFYDYLASSLKILAEGANKTRISGLREDQILLMFVTRLKELCIRLNIFIWTATQVSGDWKSIKEADQQLLRGAKAISDKVDNGAVLLPVREADKPIIASHTAKGFELEPTHVVHIYKVRRGRFNNIRLYINFDRSTCRTTDCFATNNDGAIIDIDDTNVELILDQTVDTTSSTSHLIDDTAFPEQNSDDAPPFDVGTEENTVPEAIVQPAQEQNNKYKDFGFTF